MKNSEEAIARVLAGLRDADVPVGMERRILEALEDQTPEQTRLGWRWFRPMWLVTAAYPVATSSLVCGVALAGLFAAVSLGIPAIRRLGHAPAQSKMNQVPAGSMPLVTPEAAKSVELPLSGSSARSVRKMNLRAPKEIPDSDRDSDSVALSEMRAPSHPAPPMPLTEQERLLLRIAHKNDPVEMAVLDPMRRAARDAEEGVAFQSFFGPPANEQQMTEQPKGEQPTTEQPATEQPTKRSTTTTEPSTTKASTTGDRK
jgi:hypothetical protein